MISWTLFRSVLSMTGAAALAASAADYAYAQYAERGGEVVIPESSAEAHQGIGVKAHTNFRYFIPKAGKASEQFLHQVTPDQSGGPPFAGYFYETPASLACIYRLVSPQSGCNPNTVTANPLGGSHAIAIVDAYDYPTVMSDLGVFSNQFQLTAPTNTKFQVVYASGQQPPVDTDWNVEEALDIEWAHAMAPNANIYLVEAASNSYTDLMTAVSVANQLVAAAGGGEVSMSWGGSEFSLETLSNYDGLFTRPGVVYFAAAGDSPGVEWPSTSPNVVSVGGTSISRNSGTGLFQREVTWQSGGGGPSVYQTRPTRFRPPWEANEAHRTLRPTPTPRAGFGSTIRHTGTSLVAPASLLLSGPASSTPRVTFTWRLRNSGRFTRTRGRTPSPWDPVVRTKAISPVAYGISTPVWEVRSARAANRAYYYSGGK